MENRVSGREPGIWQREVRRQGRRSSKKRSTRLPSRTSPSRTTAARPITEVAREILQRTGWVGASYRGNPLHCSRVLPDTPQTPIPLARETLVGAITAFLHSQPRRSLVLIRRALHRAIDEAGPDAMAQLGAQLATTGADWDYYPANALARRIHRVLADQLLDGRSTLVGLENVKKAAGKRVVIFANHLSYSDANLVEVLLSRGGAASLADRLTVVAGPKVYSSLQRRFSSLCFGTIKTPQSSARSSEDAVMNPREVARAARRSIEIAQRSAAPRRGAARVRRRSAQPHARDAADAGRRVAVSRRARHLDPADGHHRHRRALPDRRRHDPPGPQRRPRRPADVGRRAARVAGGNRQLMIDQVGSAIASLLPPEYRGTYDEETVR